MKATHRAGLEIVEALRCSRCCRMRRTRSRFSSISFRCTSSSSRRASSRCFLTASCFSCARRALSSLSLSAASRRFSYVDSLSFLSAVRGVVAGDAACDLEWCDAE